MIFLGNRNPHTEEQNDLRLSSEVDVVFGAAIAIASLYPLFTEYLPFLSKCQQHLSGDRSCDIGIARINTATGGENEFVTFCTFQPLEGDSKTLTFESIKSTAGEKTRKNEGRGNHGSEYILPNCYHQ